MLSTKKTDNHDKLIYNNRYVDSSINRFLDIVEFDNMVIFPLVLTKDDYDYLVKGYTNPSELTNHQYLNLLFSESIISDYKRNDESNDALSFEVSFNQLTINKLNGILYSFEKRVDRYVSLDEIIKRLIDNEYSRNRDEHYKSYKQVKKALGVLENG